MRIMTLNQVTLVSPATTANLGPGYDIFGLALEQPNDIVKLSTISKGIKIEVTGLQAETIPTAFERNTAGVVCNEIMSKFSIDAGIKIEIQKGIVPSKGLGSSAASAAAVAFGLNKMFDLNLNFVQLVKLAAQGEIASAGVEHADNVSAAIYGGFVVIKSYNPLEILKISPPRSMEICAAYPNIVTPPNKTERARAAVPKQVSMEKVVHNIGKAVGVTLGFKSGNVDDIGRSMSDAIVEPARAFLIPGYQQVKENALRAGACGVAISGAGPAMIAVVNTRKASSLGVAKAMRKGFKSAGVDSTVFTTRPGKGVSIVETR
jgi:homoserine kinase